MIDFEEDVPARDMQRLQAKVRDIGSGVQRALDTASKGRLLKAGLQVSCVCVCMRACGRACICAFVDGGMFQGGVGGRRCTALWLERERLLNGAGLSDSSEHDVPLHTLPLRRLSTLLPFTVFGHSVAILLFLA